MKHILRQAIPVAAFLVTAFITGCDGVHAVDRGTLMTSKVESLPNIAESVRVVSGQASVVLAPTGEKMIVAITDTKLTIDQPYVVADENLMVGSSHGVLRTYSPGTPWRTNYQTTLWFVTLDESGKPAGSVRVSFFNKGPYGQQE